MNLEPFTSLELDCIHHTLMLGVDVSPIFKYSFRGGQIRSYSQGQHIDKQDFSDYILRGFNFWQARVLHFAKEKGFDMSKYENLLYNDQQLVWIFAGLNVGVDVSIYDHYTTPGDKMEEMYRLLSGNAILS